MFVGFCGQAGLSRDGRVWCLVVTGGLLVACGVVPATPGLLLESSFAQQINGIAGVEQVERVGSELTFTHPNTDGELVQWRVVIDSATVHPSGPDAEPERGDVVSSWYADGVLVEPVGSMSRLPDVFLETGVAQQCYALWDSEAGAWEW